MWVDYQSGSRTLAAYTYSLYSILLLPFPSLPFPSLAASCIALLVPSFALSLGM